MKTPPAPAQITPLPWEYTSSWTPDGYAASIVVRKDGAFQKRIALVEYDGSANPRANAAYIVRACNAYPQLMAALEAVLAWQRRTVNYPASLDCVEAALDMTKEGK